MPFLVRPIMTPTPTEDSNGNKEVKPLESNGKPVSGKLRYTIVNIFIATFLVVYGAQTIPTNHLRYMAPAPLQPAVTYLKNAIYGFQDVTEPWLHRLGIHQHTWSMFSSKDSYNMYERYEASITFQDGSKATWTSPDWNSMSWLEKKRNRRRMLYQNNLKAFQEEDTIGQKHLCEWIANQYDKDVEKIKLVYHWANYPKPSKDLGWFEPVRNPKDEVTTSAETHYIYYAPSACDQWATEGECDTDPEFMQKHCSESCEFGDVQYVKVGSRVLIYWQEDSSFYSGTVLKIRDKKAKRFYIKWDVADEGHYEWYDLDNNIFVFIGVNEGEEKSDTVVTEQHDGTEL